jgi:hypothetical protein
MPEIFMGLFFLLVVAIVIALLIVLIRLSRAVSRSNVETREPEWGISPAIIWTALKDYFK